MESQKLFVASKINNSEYNPISIGNITLNTNTSNNNQPNPNHEYLKLQNSKSPKLNENNPNCDSMFQCHLCDKKFKRQTHLQQHLVTHEPRQWDCDVCKKTFTTKYFLKKHKRLHTGKMICHRIRKGK